MPRCQQSHPSCLVSHGAYSPLRPTLFFSRQLSKDEIARPGLLQAEQLQINPQPQTFLFGKRRSMLAAPPAASLETTPFPSRLGLLLLPSSRLLLGVISFRLLQTPSKLRYLDCRQVFEAEPGYPVQVLLMLDVEPSSISMAKRTVVSDRRLGRDCHCRSRCRQTEPQTRENQETQRFVIVLRSSNCGE